MARRYLTSFIAASALVAGCALYSFPAMAADPPVDVEFAPPAEITFPPPEEIKFSVEAFDKATVTTFEDKSVLTVLNGDVNFEVDSDQLTPRAREVLDGLAAEWAKTTPSKVTIVGHTDSVADDAYNLDLSKRRAASVGQYLSSKVAGLQMSTDGKGESEPIADNATDEGKAQNRRVEIRAEK